MSSTSTTLECPLCGRPLGTQNIDRHHLVPKTFGGKEQFSIHRMCHRKIHATFTERELLQSYHTWEALREHPMIADYVRWVARKPPELYLSSDSAARKR